MHLDDVSDQALSQIRSKRKHDDELRNDILELKEQMKEMMALLTSINNLHTDSINKLSQDVSTIKDEVRNIGNTIDNLR